MNEKRIIKTLLEITAAIVFINIVDIIVGQPSWQVTRLINVGYEANIPTWFSSILLFIASIYAFLCSNNTIQNKKRKILLGLFSLGLLYMSCDETAQIHENLGNTLNKYFIRSELITHSAWVIILGPILLIFITYFTLELKKHLNSRTFKYIFAGTLTYCFGAFILEATLNIIRHSNFSLLTDIENILEETCEMLGSIMLIKGLKLEYNIKNERNLRNI